MITNERQYRITKAWLEKFEQGAARVEDAAEGLHPRLRQAMRDQYEGQAEELRAQIKEYESLRAGRIKQLRLRSFADLPNALIYGRIAAGLTHKELAERLAMTEQQVQRYEARSYRGVGVERLQQIADALDVKASGTVTLPRPKMARRGRRAAHKEHARAHGTA